MLSGTTMCKDGEISYQLLLGASLSSVDSDSSYSSSYKGINEVALNFCLEDGTHQKLVVEENLRVLDVCQLLALKFNVARSHTWSLVEQLSVLGIERSLEDHEDVLKVYSSWGPHKEENKFIFKQDFSKYEFFTIPQQFFPLSMLDLEATDYCLAENPDHAKLLTLQNLLNSGDKFPVVQSLLWCQEPGKSAWKRLFFRIEGTTLYVASASYSAKEKSDQLWPFRDLLEHEIYTPIDTGSSPTSNTFCLKSQNNEENLLWFSCDSRTQRQCWIVAMRLSKYGLRIRENYKEVQTRFSSTAKNNFLDSVEYTPMRARVAMDFTGSHSRVVEDPLEVKAIEAAEGHTWKRRLPCCIQSPTARPAMEFGVHAIQPWFYSGMSRDEATQLLTKYGTVDGVFLVRESRRNPGSFVLSYVYHQKVHHCQIFPVEDKDQLCYSLDNGKTKFYDLLQLVEFYQLNIGSLPTKLTHFLVHRKSAK